MTTPRDMSVDGGPTGPGSGEDMMIGGCLVSTVGVFSSITTAVAIVRLLDDPSTIAGIFVVLLGIGFIGAVFSIFAGMSMMLLGVKLRAHALINGGKAQ